MKKIVPYDFQLTFVDNIIRKFKKGRTTLAVLPTGGGKTVCFALAIDRYLRHNPDKSVMILVHRQELLEQAKETIDIMFPEYGVDFIVAGVKFVKKTHIYIGMVETVNTRAGNMGLLNLGLVIIDEAHIGNFIKMHDIFVDELVMGFTATPISASKKHPMKDYFKTITVGPQVSELIKLKRLAQNITRCPKDIVQEASLQVDMRTGDFDMMQMAFEFKRPKYVSNTVAFYEIFCHNQKTIVYNVNIDHSQEVTYWFNKCGYPCKHIDGTTSFEERKATLKWLKETDNAIVCNVGIINVGFDEPTVRNIIVNLATLSLAKWKQMGGRGARYIQENPMNIGEGKDHFNIIDLGGNSIRFGDWNEDVDWEHVFNNPPVPGKPGLAPVKVCPQCQGLVHAAQIQCKLPSVQNPDEICGYIFDRKKWDREQVLGEMIIVTKGVDIDNIIKKAQNKKAYFGFFEMGRIMVDKLYEMGIPVSQKEKELLFECYFDKCKEWHEAIFPGKKFNEAWHRELARKHFYNCINSKKTKSITF